MKPEMDSLSIILKGDDGEFTDGYGIINRTLELNKTQNRVITFKASKEDDDYLNFLIKRHYVIDKLKLSKSSVIRAIIIKAHMISYGGADEFMFYRLNANMIKAYEAIPIINMRKAVRSLKDKLDDYPYAHEKVNKMITLRVLQEERDMIDFAVKDLNKIEDTNVSVADYIRHCIRAERYYFEHYKNGKKTT